MPCSLGSGWSLSRKSTSHPPEVDNVGKWEFFAQALWVEGSGKSDGWIFVGGLATEGSIAGPEDSLIPQNVFSNQF